MTESPPYEILGGAGATPDPWDTLIGPFYDEPGLAALLRAQPVTLDSLVADGAILGTTPEDGTPLYPTFQFGPAGELLHGLRSVIDKVQRSLGIGAEQRFIKLHCPWTDGKDRHRRLPHPECSLS